MRCVLPSLYLLCAIAVSCARHKLQPDELERNQLITEILRREDARTLGEDGFFSSHLSGSPYRRCGSGVPSLWAESATRVRFPGFTTRFVPNMRRSVLPQPLPSAQSRIEHSSNKKAAGRTPEPSRN